MRVAAVSEPAKPDHPNEDFLATDDRLVVVLDGCGVAQSLAGTLDRGCTHGVSWYAHRLGTELFRRAQDPAVPLADALAGAIVAARDAHGGCDLSNPDTPAATATVLRQRGAELDYLVLSDSCVVLDRVDGTEPTVLCDDRLARVMPAGERGALDDPDRAARDQARRAIRADLLNRSGGFWVASTDPAAAAQAITGTVPTGEVRRALVASDGGVRLVEFGELSFPKLLDLVEAEGPAAVVARTRRAETGDPRALRYPRGKQYDDATLAFCTFS